MQLEPYNNWLAVAPSDTVDLVPFTQRKMLTKALYVGTGGDLALVSEDNNVVVWPSVPSGTVLRVAVRRVNVSGTAASNLVACYVV